MKNKIRKPEEYISLSQDVCAAYDLDDSNLPISIVGWWLTLDQSKRLHVWLSKAIAYLEQEKNK